MWIYQDGWGRKFGAKVMSKEGWGGTRTGKAMRAKGNIFGPLEFHTPTSWSLLNHLQMFKSEDLCLCLCPLLHSRMGLEKLILCLRMCGVCCWYLMKKSLTLKGENMNKCLTRLSVSSSRGLNLSPSHGLSLSPSHGQEYMMWMQVVESQDSAKVESQAKAERGRNWFMEKKNS